MNGLISLKSCLKQLAQRLAQFSDPEKEQAIKLRLTIGIGLIAYFCLPWSEGESFAEAIVTLPSVMTLVYYSGALMIAVAIVIRPRPSPVRRVFGIALDLISLSVVMFFAGSESVFLFVLYLWVILGNGFRYGTAYLYISQAIGTVGFALSITWGEYWQDIQHQPIGLSLLILIILIPFYTGFLIKKLHSAIDSAKLANQAKSRFLANMSHELRTPLNGVIGIADLMGETDLNSEQREFVKIMRNSANTLLGLIENVLDISKIEAGKVESIVSQFDLHELTTTIIRMQTPMAETKDIHLFCNLDPDIAFDLDGDPQHLKQVLINLIGNAIKFTRQGFVRLSLKAVDSEADKQTVRFEVTDTGIGIPAEELDTIFDDFTQVHAASGAAAGTGLGTTISKELVELMGGKIGVSSQLGIGTTFWFELPFKVNKDKTMSLENYSILILSNESQQRELNTIMQTWGISADWADNSAKAMATLIQKAESGQPYSTLIVDSDVMLEIEPAKFARLIKSDALLSDLSLILINSNSRLISDDISNHFISVIQGKPAKTPLFNALHAAHSSINHNENVVRLADFYASQGMARPLRVLICEDNKVNQHVLRGVLHHAGHKTMLAETGDAALDMLSERARDIDMVILDMNMPGMSGLDVLKAFRFIDTSASIPVIMLTADATPEARQNCEQAGANAFLTKPINSRALLEKVAHLSAGLALDDAVSKEKAATEKSAESLIDESTIKQLIGLGDRQFLHTLVESFKHDALKHISLIQSYCHDDYLGYRESLHALKGSATEMSASRLASLCASAEQVKPDQLGHADVLSIVDEIEKVFTDTIMQLEQRFQSELHGSGRI
ncbi:ATP-binding protein [Methylophaga sp.]|uniref:ATP-binding protein n=1 Tax=Methylophaga sp. TaxID=2024840 RepID=UPI0025D831D5|nr:ATP-binding protein [Methylophaga sp.]